MVCGILFMKIVQNTCHKLEIQIVIENCRKLGFIFQQKQSQILDIVKNNLALKITWMYTRYTY